MPVVIGPSGGNQCCICGGLQSHLNPPASEITERSGCLQKCKVAQNISFNVVHGEPANSTCIPRCCPCPFTGAQTLDVDFIFSGCYTDRTITWTQTIQLTSGSGIPACTTGHGDLTSDAGCGAVPCYNSNPGYEGFVNNSAHPFEKYAGSGTLCTDGFAGAECSGKPIGVTLCCCDYGAEQDDYADTNVWKDCNICNYKLTVNFLPISGKIGDDYCYCPIDPYGFDDAHILPGNDPDNGFECNNLGLNLYSGICPTGDGTAFGDNFVLHFMRTGLWWNCDCCQGGDQEDDQVVAIFATVTKT